MECARRLLRERFGHDAFQGLQEEVIRAVLAGEDVLLIAPTGGGKSLCYQLPALVFEGLTVVISPLIALMQDQVESLRRRGLAATFINSSLDKEERERRMVEVAAGAHDLLYVTPERFRKPAFRELMAGLPVALLAVDEAHCITSWGHDFRPAYGRLGEIRRLLGEPPTIALTATATPETQEGILTTLGIPGARVFHAGIERPELHVAVHEVADREEKIARILALVERVGGPGIVYLALIRELRELEDELRRRGLDPLVYHGRLSAHERRRMQEDFFASRSRVVLATNAFGMGVDKADIRFIVHGQIPGSPEAYFQEIGRAGRDGRPAICELLYLPEDLLIQKQFIEWANPAPDFLRSVHDLMVNWGDTLHARSEEEIVETLLLKNRGDGRVATVLGLLDAAGITRGSFERGDLRLERELEPGEERELVAPGKRDRDLQRLLDIVQYAREDGCRRRRIERYFGFAGARDCGNCDRCLSTDDWLAGHFEAGVEAVVEAAGADEAPVRRGEWLEIGRGHHVVVRKVEHSRRGTVVEVECADDLQVRSYDLARVRWRKLH
ncbi:MAG: ATP-dependent DNA helicase RecQ [Planctomycetes bacterium]|nr:ATP-dependent DNA helicase RecQ [Planctomycetota bacterium]